MAANKYIFFRNDQEQIQFEFDPTDPACLDQVGYRYFGRVLNLLEPQIKDQGLIIYVTGWTVHELPSYGSNVVACILQDEWSREPQYRDKVGMIFRTCGKSPFVTEAYKYGDWRDVLTNFLAQMKAVLKDGVGRSKMKLVAMQGGKLAPIYNIPLGYFPLSDVPFVPMKERTHDLYFAGSIRHTEEITFFKRPKELARNRMVEAFDEVKKRIPEIKLKSKITGGFTESISADNASYLENMMNAKICPVPRGNNLETFRFYEAVRYGCIPVAEALPDDYFYNEAPVIRLKNWADLQVVVTDLLQDEEKLQDLHQKVLNWWEVKCSESATAKIMSHKIKESMH